MGQTFRLDFEHFKQIINDDHHNSASAAANELRWNTENAGVGLDQATCCAIVDAIFEGYYGISRADSGTLVDVEVPFTVDIEVRGGVAEIIKISPPIEAHEVRIIDHDNIEVGEASSESQSPCECEMRESCSGTIANNPLSCSEWGGRGCIAWENKRAGREREAERKRGQGHTVLSPQG